MICLMSSGFRATVEPVAVVGGCWPGGWVRPCDASISANFAATILSTSSCWRAAADGGRRVLGGVTRAEVMVRSSSSWRGAGGGAGCW